MNIYEANMFDSRKLNLRLLTNALKLDKQLTGSYIYVVWIKERDFSQIISLF